MNNAECQILRYHADLLCECQAAHRPCVLARYHRLMGVPSFFLTGTDEHGQKVSQAAEKAGMTPQQQADGTVVRFQDAWKKFEITNDDFIRTTEPRHKTVVQAILQDLFDKDEIYRADYDGWYCVTCERFFTEKDLIDGKCPEPGCGRDVEKIRAQVFEMAQESNVPIKEQDIEVIKTTRGMRVKTVWSEEVDILGIYQKTFDFKIDVEE